MAVLPLPMRCGTRQLPKAKMGPRWGPYVLICSQTYDSSIDGFFRNMNLKEGCFLILLETLSSNAFLIIQPTARVLDRERHSR